MSLALSVGALDPVATGVVCVPYRDIRRPADYRERTTTESWVEWGDEERLFPSVAPTPGEACEFCRGAVGYRDDGTTFDMCPHCRQYETILDALVPIAYSVSDGLESMLHRHKDFEGMQWLAIPLASLLYEFLEVHLACIETTFGNVGVATAVPSGDTSRSFNHIQHILDRIDDWPVEWNLDLLTKSKPGRPPRREVDSSYYAVSDASMIEGQTVLLFDDVWTSGASMVSAAASLRAAGARKIVGLTLGRQVTPGFGSSDDLIEIAHQRAVNLRRCVLCE